MSFKDEQAHEKSVIKKNSADEKELNSNMLLVTEGINTQAVFKGVDDHYGDNKDLFNGENISDFDLKLLADDDKKFVGGYVIPALDREKSFRSIPCLAGQLITVGSTPNRKFYAAEQAFNNRDKLADTKYTASDQTVIFVAKTSKQNK